MILHCSWGLGGVPRSILRVDPSESGVDHGPVLVGAGCVVARISSEGSSFKGHQMVGVERRETKWRTHCSGPSKFVEYFGPEGLAFVPMTCGGCPHCRWVKRNSFASAAEMEMQVSDWCVFLTLTVRPGEKIAISRKTGKIVPWDKVTDDCEIVDLTKKLCLPILQKCQKDLGNHRKRETHSFEGVNVSGWRYVQVGEYGDKRGRPHYHVLIFGKGDIPAFLRDCGEFRRRRKRESHPVDERRWIPEWPYGHVHVMRVSDRRAGFYLAKYVSKSPDSFCTRSNQYAIGGEYVRRLAAKLAGKWLVPTVDWKVGQGVRRIENGRILPYRALLTGANRRYLLEGFAAGNEKGVLSLVRLLPKEIRHGVVAVELRRRRRVFKAVHGCDPILCDDRIKLGVMNDYRAELGLPPLANLSGKLVSEMPPRGPPRHVSTGVRGRENIMRWPLGPRPNVFSRLDYLQEAFDGSAEGQAAARAAADPEEAAVVAGFQAFQATLSKCSCPDCLTANRLRIDLYRRKRRSSGDAVAVSGDAGIGAAAAG